MAMQTAPASSGGPGGEAPVSSPHGRSVPLAHPVADGCAGRPAAP